jgi:methylmalonyl-CoA mutase
LDLDSARRQLAFVLALDADQFMGIAKLRGLRRLWARVEEACGLDPQPVRINGESAWRGLSKRDPWVNMLRTTMATFVAGIGGADSCTTLPFSAPLGLADAFARRIARNQQTVLIEESNLWRVADPAAGAGGYEALSDQLCEAAWALFQQIEKGGGVIGALTSGTIHKMLDQARGERERGVALRKLQLTGTNEFPLLDAADVTVLDIAPNADGLPRVSGEAGSPHSFGEMVAAFKAGMTRDEAASANVVRDGPAAEPLVSSRLAEPFEALRDRADASMAASGERPAIFMASLGPIARHTVRSTWIKNLMAAGGIAAEVPAGYEETGALGEAFKASGAKIACIASSDEVYAEMAADAASALKKAGAERILLAGRPGELEGPLKGAGVDQFVFAGNDMLELLGDLLDRLGAPPAKAG